jgi:hypothetical protein
MTFELRAPDPGRLVLPVPVDASGPTGPTRGAAAGPRWRRTTPGLYVPASAPDTVEQRIAEQAGRAGPRGAVTGWAALRLSGVGFCDGLAGDGVTPLPVPLVEGDGRIRSHPDVDVSRETLPPGEVVERYGVRCTTRERALYDEVRDQPVRWAVVHVDMTLAAGVLERDRWAAYVASRFWHVRVRHAREVLDLAVITSRSPGESLLRLIWVVDGGWRAPLCNPYVTDEHGTIVGMPDLLDPELGVVAEYDGAVHRTREAHRRDLAREHAFRQLGLEYVAFTGPDLAEPRLVVERLAAARTRARARAGAGPHPWGVALPSSVDTPRSRFTA